MAPTTTPLFPVAAAEARIASPAAQLARHSPALARIVRGSAVHSKTFSEVEFLNDVIIGVDHAGKVWPGAGSPAPPF